MSARQVYGPSLGEFGADTQLATALDEGYVMVDDFPEADVEGPDLQESAFWGTNDHQYNSELAVQQCALREYLWHQSLIEDGPFASLGLLAVDDQGPHDLPALVALYTNAALDGEEESEYDPLYDPRHTSYSNIANASTQPAYTSMENSLFMSSSSSSGSFGRSPSQLSFHLLGHLLVGLDEISGGAEGYFFTSAPLKLADPESYLGKDETLAIDQADK